MLVFIDESGDHNLDINKSDHSYDVFVLGAVLFTQKDYLSFEQNLQQLKKKFFGKDDFILHTRELTRPSKAKDKRNLKLFNTDFRFQFYTALNQLIAQSHFSIVATAIVKEKFVNNYLIKNKDPYIFSFEFLLNRIISHCRGQKCQIFPEKRTHREDLKLQLAWLKTQKIGTQLFKAIKIKQSVQQFNLIDKSSNVSGLQLADLVVTPIGRHLIHKKAKALGNEVIYQVISKKMNKQDLLVIS